MATNNNDGGDAVADEQRRNERAQDDNIAAAVADNEGTAEGGGGDGRDDDHDLDTVLNVIKNNLKQLDENCYIIYNRMNRIEMDCIDLLQPMGDIISLEKSLERLSELGSHLSEVLRSEENN